jgi:hypothetical protein
VCALHEEIGKLFRLDGVFVAAPIVDDGGDTKGFES